MRWWRGGHALRLLGLRVSSAAQDALRAVTGLPISACFTASQWAWLLEHAPGSIAGQRAGARQRHASEAGRARAPFCRV